MYRWSRILEEELALSPSAVTTVFSSENLAVVDSRFTQQMDADLVADEALQ